MGTAASEAVENSRLVSVTIRRAVAGDETALSAVAGATFHLACPPHTTPESIAAFVRDVLSPDNFRAYLADPQRVLLIAEEAGVAVGYVMLVAGEPYDADVAATITLRPTVELSKIYVLESHLGRGIALALLDASVAASRELGVRGMWLGTNQLNVRAQRFYEKHGFARVGAKRFLVGDAWEDDYVFELPL